MNIAAMALRLSETLHDAADWIENAAGGQFYFGKGALYTQAASMRHERNAFDIGRETGAIHGRAPTPPPVRRLHPAKDRP